jgi:adenine specific DNA methylase Mod
MKEELIKEEIREELNNTLKAFDVIEGLSFDEYLKHRFLLNLKEHITYLKSLL